MVGVLKPRPGPWSAIHRMVGSTMCSLRGLIWELASSRHPSRSPSGMTWEIAKVICARDMATRSPKNTSSAGAY
eukprot:9957684-Heterocapsa_arctica.AAC.1